MRYERLSVPMYKVHVSNWISGKDYGSLGPTIGYNFG